jgi:asparagine synthase (glutamine-hydrolysing)
LRLICGFVRLDGAPAEAAMLNGMLTALKSPGLTPSIMRMVEGPAAMGVLHFGGEPVDEASGCLPRGADDTWLAADLRTDRPDELADTLDLPAGTRDSALALGALARWGADLPDRLDGDFALAAWRPRAPRLICCRDIMGVRPLCYAHRPGQLFAFASLPRGLHASGVVPRRLDAVGLGRLMIEIDGWGEQTGFEGISWLPAGHSLQVTADGVELNRAWRPDFTRIGSWRGSAPEAAATLRSLLEDAVACRLSPAGPVAAHLSGGLDSSALAVIASRQLQAQGRVLYAFSQLARPCFRDMVRDEREYVDVVLAQEPGIRWSPAYLPSLDEEGIIDPDLPVAGSLAVPQDGICAAAAAAGCDRLLSGAGGDETATYNGANILAAMLLQGRWSGLPRRLRARALRLRQPLVRVLVSQLVVPFFPKWLGDRRLRRRRISTLADRRRNALSFLKPSLAVPTAAALPPDADWRNRPHDRIEMLNDSYLVGRGNRWSILGARYGVAYTYPLLDRRIIDFMLSLPLEYFLDGGFSRQPFRNAMAGILPESIRWRDTKFVPFPDIPAGLAAAASGLLARVEALQVCVAVTELFDLDAIAAAFSAIARDHSANGALAPESDGQDQMPRLSRMALHATHALSLAEHVARLT